MRRVAFCRKSFLNKKDMKSLLKKGHQLSPSQLLTVHMKIQTHNQLNISDMSAKNGQNSPKVSENMDQSRNSKSQISKKSWFKNTSIEIDSKKLQKRSQILNEISKNKRYY
jgi:hypothetical protein